MSKNLTPTQADIVFATREASRVANRTGARVRVTIGAITVEIDPVAPTPPPVPASPPTEGLERYEGERAAAEWIRRNAARRAPR